MHHVEECSASGDGPQCIEMPIFYFIFHEVSSVSPEKKNKHLKLFTFHFFPYLCRRKEKMKFFRQFFILFICAACSLHLSARQVVWVIDAGHGGHDVGCEFGYVYEKDITLSIAKEVGRLVKKNLSDVRVVFTREKNTFLSLQERCNVANARRAELFISIHVNSAPNPFARGTESFFANNVPLRGSQAGKSELLALLLQKHYISQGREVSRGVKKRELYVCEHTNMTSVLTEVGFITNSAERKYITSKDGQAELAKAIYESLCEWKQLTKDGKVPQRTLRNLRLRHFGPLTVNTTPSATASQSSDETASAGQAAATPQAQAQAEADVRDKQAAEAKAVAEAQAQEQARMQAAGTAAAATTVPQAADTLAAGAGKTYFAIQLMNTSARLNEGDYRLKGFTGVRFISAGERFKCLYSYSESYLDIKNELVQVRETFPEAFIVAFHEGRQITTAEALQLIQR